MEYYILQPLAEIYTYQIEVGLVAVEMVLYILAESLEWQEQVDNQWLHVELVDFSYRPFWGLYARTYALRYITDIY